MDNNNTDNSQRESYMPYNEAASAQLEQAQHYAEHLTQQNAQVSAQQAAQAPRMNFDPYTGRPLNNNANPYSQTNAPYAQAPYGQVQYGQAAQPQYGQAQYGQAPYGQYAYRQPQSSAAYAQGNMSYNSMQRDIIGPETKPVLAILSLVFGILSFILCSFDGYPGIIAGIAAVVLSSLYKKANPHRRKGTATAGKILGILGIIASTIWFLIILILYIATNKL